MLVPNWCSKKKNFLFQQLIKVLHSLRSSITFLNNWFMLGIVLPLMKVENSIQTKLQGGWLGCITQAEHYHVFTTDMNNLLSMVVTWLILLKKWHHLFISPVWIYVISAAGWWSCGLQWSLGNCTVRQGYSTWFSGTTEFSHHTLH